MTAAAVKLVNIGVGKCFLPGICRVDVMFAYYVCKCNLTDVWLRRWCIRKIHYN